MIAALFRRTVSANAIRVLACGIGLLAWGLVLPLVYSAFGKTLGTFIRDNPLLSQYSQYGGGDLFSLTGAMAIGFIHPFTLLLMGITAVGLPVISIAGERQRGTLEVLLARPISRHTLFSVLFATGALFLGLLMALELLANVVSASAVGVGGELDLSRVPILWLNGWLLFMAFMAIGFAASVSFDRLGPALGVTLVVLVVSYLLDVISSLWPAAAWLGDYSLFSYVKAKPILEGHVSPLDFVLLAAVTAIAVGYAWWEFPRRDIAAPS
jgi:ABC-2 type transport system permease protein